MSSSDKVNPFEEELKDTLRALDAIDRMLLHDPDVPWPKNVADGRNGLVWHALDLARELDFKWGIGYDALAASYNTIVYIWVPINGEPKQLSWHVPGGVVWDGHTRDEKSRRISEYTKETP